VSYETRIERARELAGRYSFAREILTFYQQVAAFQQKVYEYLAAFPLDHNLNIELVLPWFPQFLASVRLTGPQALSQSADELARQNPSQWSILLTSYWSGSSLSPHDTFFARAFLQPYAEQLASTSPRQGSRLCPVCGRKPVAGVLREKDLGAKRSLVCSLCATEWHFDRLACPSCGETSAEAISVYTSDPFDNVRVNTCQTCKTYIKTVDLTKNALAVPMVDEIASIPLDLWAQEQGYKKLEMNLLGF